MTAGVYGMGEYNPDAPHVQRRRAEEFRNWQDEARQAGLVTRGLELLFTEVAKGDRLVHSDLNWRKMGEMLTAAVGSSDEAFDLIERLAREMPRRPFNPH